MFISLVSSQIFTRLNELMNNVGQFCILLSIFRLKVVSNPGIGVKDEFLASWQATRVVGVLHFTSKCRFMPQLNYITVPLQWLVVWPYQLKTLHLCQLLPDVNTFPSYVNYFSASRLLYIYGCIFRMHRFLFRCSTLNKSISLFSSISFCFLTESKRSVSTVHFQTVLVIICNFNLWGAFVIRSAVHFPLL